MQSLISAVNDAAVQAQSPRVSSFLRQFAEKLDKRDIKALERISKKLALLTREGALRSPEGSVHSGVMQLAILHEMAAMIRETKVGEDLFFRCFAVELGDFSPLIQHLNEIGLKEMVSEHNADLAILTNAAKGASE
jgi:hypothetical protein